MNNIIFVLISIAIYITIHLVINLFIKVIRKKKEDSFLPFGLQVIRGVIFITIVLIDMNKFEATKQICSSVLANISLLVVVLGFVAQESIKNILSGIMIAQSRPFKIGQRITLKNQNITGIIDAITLRHLLSGKPITLWL